MANTATTQDFLNQLNQAEAGLRQINAQVGANPNATYSSTVGNTLNTAQNQLQGIQQAVTPTLTQGTPPIPTAKIDISGIQPTIGTDALYSPTTNLDIAKLLSQNQEIYQNYVKSNTDSIATLRDLSSKYQSALLPSSEEQANQQLLVSKKKQLADFDTSLATGQQAQYGSGIPLELATGRANQLTQNAALTRTSYVNEINSLVDQLGLQQQNRQLQQQVYQGQMSEAEKEVSLNQSIFQAASQQANNFITLASKLQDQQRQKLADILDATKGINPDQFNPQEQAYIASIAAQAGMPYNLVYQGLKANYATASADALYRQAQIANEQRLANTSYNKNQSSVVGGGTVGDGTILSPTAQAVISNPNLINNLTPSVKGKVIAELQSAGYDISTLGSKPLSDTAIKEINQTTTALNSLSDLRTIIQNNPNKLGPITGFAALNPWSEARKIQADIDRVKQQVGKALEGGVLRKEDEDKYKKILATINDTPSTALYKIDQLTTNINKSIEDYKTLQTGAGRSSNVTGSLGKKDQITQPDGSVWEKAANGSYTRIK